MNQTEVITCSKSEVNSHSMSAVAVIRARKTVI